MGRNRRPELDRPVNIQFPDWELFGDQKLRAPHFIMLPMQFRNEHRWDMPGDLFKFFCHLIAHAALQSRPGVIYGDAYSLSRACRCKPESALSYVSRLIERQLIQEVGEVTAPRIEEKKLEERKEKAAFGHSSLPDWIFDHVGLTRYPDGLENPWFTRETFGRGIWERYPKIDQAAFGDVYGYLQCVIYNEPWLAFVQTCLRNYVELKSKEGPNPSFHNPQNFFMKVKWWEFFRNKNGSIPTHFKATGTAGSLPGDPNIIHHTRPDIQNNVEELDDDAERQRARAAIGALEALKETASKAKTGL